MMIASFALTHARHLAIGCAENLCIWEAKTATLLCKFTPPNGEWVAVVHVCVCIFSRLSAQSSWKRPPPILMIYGIHVYVLLEQMAFLCKRPPPF